MMKLSSLEPGQSAEIVSVRSPDGMQCRLYDLGFVPGARIKCIMKSPLGDPKAFRICGAVIAIRRETCEGVGIKNIR